LQWRRCDQDGRHIQHGRTDQTQDERLERQCLALLQWIDKRKDRQPRTELLHHEGTVNLIRHEGLRLADTKDYGTNQGLFGGDLED
jgi:hypothetical protein